MNFIKIVAILLFAAIYFVSPLDLLPDLIPLLGWGDDLAVAGWSWSAIARILEEGHKQASPGNRQ